MSGSSSLGVPRRSALHRRAEVAVSGVVEKRLGALPVVAGFLRRLDVAGTVDRACPIGGAALSTHGQVIEVLIANRLTSPLPLQHVSGWAAEWAVDEVFGLSAGLLNDDRLARALDAIAPQLESITGSVGARAIDVFGLDVASLHWDMTSMSLYGAYLETEEDFPAPAWGHPKDRRTDLKQIQAGLAVTADGGVPVFGRAYDGGAAEVSQVTDAMNSLSAMAGARKFLMVGDSKLISWKNVDAMSDAGVGFIAPLGAARVPEGLFASLESEAARIVDYTASRDINTPPDSRCVYRILEDTMELRGRRRRDRTHTLRRILVHSTANATAAANARALKLARTTEDLDKLVRTAGTRYYPDTQAVTAKLTQITKKRKVTAYLRTQVTLDTATGKPELAWHFDQQVIDTEAAGDGWYALLSNLDPAQADATEIFTRYKGQPAVERRYGDFKGPLAVTPMFLHHNRRIAALITVICLALLIFCLIERQVRQTLLPATGLIGFYAYDNRTVKPTGRLIFHALSRIRYRPAHGSSPPKILIPEQIQTRLLQLLKIDPTQPRWTE